MGTEHEDALWSCNDELVICAAAPLLQSPDYEALPLSSACWLHPIGPPPVWTGYSVSAQPVPTSNSRSSGTTRGDWLLTCSRLPHSDMEIASYASGLHFLIRVILARTSLGSPRRRLGAAWLWASGVPATNYSATVCYFMALDSSWLCHNAWLVWCYLTRLPSGIVSVYYIRLVRLPCGLSLHRSS